MQTSANRAYWIGIARAFGGATIFSLPMLMTMELWWLGFYMAPGRLALLLFITFPLLVALSHFAGFEETGSLTDNLLDALAAYAVAFTAAAVTLGIFDVVRRGMPVNEIIGKISLQAIPGSIGALLARAQLGGEHAREQAKKQTEQYFDQLFLMSVGALFLALNVAPTEEMVLIAYRMATWQGIVLALLSLVVMHSFVYALRFRGQALVPAGTPQWSLFLRFTVVGYVLSLAIGAYLLWTFGRMEDHALAPLIMMVLVIGFPAAVGAAAARLIL